MKKINSNVQNAINSFNAADFNSIPVGLDKDAIVGMTKQCGSLQPAPIWGYEVQFANQQVTEMKVNAIKDKFAKMIKEMTGMVVSDSKVGRKARRAKKKVRKAAKEKCRASFKKMEIRSAKQELKLAKAGYEMAKGTPAEEVYLLDIKYYNDKLAQLAA